MLTSLTACGLRRGAVPVIGRQARRQLSRRFPWIGRPPPLQPVSRRPRLYPGSISDISWVRIFRVPPYQPPVPAVPALHSRAAAPSAKLRPAPKGRLPGPRKLFRTTRHLLRDAQHQLVTDLRLRRVNRVRRQYQKAGRARIRRGPEKRRKGLHGSITRQSSSR